MKNIMRCAVLFVCLLGVLITPNLLHTQPIKSFDVQLDGAEAVYDGDTLKDVAVKLKEFPNGSPAPAEVLWPGILLKDGTLYVVVDIRVRGIDTAEKRPTHKGRTSESLALEKQVAEESRQFVVNLLASSNFRFRIHDPEQGKYSGRIVCDVFIGDVNLADTLIENGLGYIYNGGQKREFDEWYQKPLD